MKVIIRNCRNKRLKASLVEAIEFYSRELMHPNLSRNLGITLRLKGMKNCYGECSTSWHNKQGKARKFSMTINPKEEDPLFTLAHEMYHVKQFAKGELSDCLTFWKSRKISEDTPYRKQPWEVEAFNNDYQLYRKFMASKGIVLEI